MAKEEKNKLLGGRTIQGVLLDALCHLLVDVDLWNLQRILLVEEVILELGVCTS
jgi:hypothetical protein